MLFSIHDLNVIIEVWCASFSVVGLLCVGLLARTTGHASHWYRRGVSLMFGFHIAAALSDAVGGICRGQLTPLGMLGSYAGNTLTFVFTYLLAGAFTSYLCARLDAHGDLSWWGGIAWAVCGVGVALTLAGLFFYIDPITNIYHRSGHFWISQAIGVFVQLGNLVAVIAHRRAIRPATLVTMLIYILLPSFALVAELFSYGINLTQMALTISLMVLFIDLQSLLAEDMASQQSALARQEREFVNSRVQIMVSQIQPHFLYNTLDSIYYLCGKDPARARDAISRFSDHLRTNLRSLRTTKPVPFADELAHVQNYLELEQMSSDDTIAFVLDAPATNFRLPALSLQPLVENAVKHGVTKRTEGGTITLRTRELPDAFEVTVADDGVGFDQDAAPDQSRPHVGVQNVRHRIESMCGGTLTVQSTPGVGTVATVTIPKGAKR